jgi:hypothetical protein
MAQASGLGVASSSGLGVASSSGLLGFKRMKWAAGEDVPVHRVRTLRVSGMPPGPPAGRGTQELATQRGVVFARFFFGSGWRCAGVGQAALRPPWPRTSAERPGQAQPPGAGGFSLRQPLSEPRPGSPGDFKGARKAEHRPAS